MIASIDRPITTDVMDAMSDEDFAALELECDEGRHAPGSCPMCTDDGPTVDIDADWRTDRSYVDTLWDRRGWTDYRSRAATIEDRADAVLLASKMVTSFVDTFATARTGGRYAVSFDPNVAVAGTNYDARRIVISPAPVLDDTIDAQTAGTILTAMAVHEASHVRYGGESRITQVRRAFGKRVDWQHPHADIAQHLNNVLEDARIERRFVTDYPGYTHVFDPANDYVARAAKRAAGMDPDSLIVPDIRNLPATAAQALRYADHVDWTGVEHVRAWWTDWMNRWAFDDRPRSRVRAIREAIEAMTAMDDPRQSQGSGEAPEDDTDSDDPGQSGDEPTADSDDEETGSNTGSGGDDGDGSDTDDEDADEDDRDDTRSDDGSYDDDAEDDGPTDDDLEDMPQDDAGSTETGDAADDDDADESDDGDAQTAANEAAQALANEFAAKAFTACPTQATAAAAIANGVAASDIDGRTAQEIVNDNETLDDVELDLGDLGTLGDFSGRHEWKVEVKPARSVGYGGIQSVTPAPSATAAVRNALVRSRSGHSDIEHGTKRGRCDNQSLTRIAHNDYRLFHRRSAPSPGRYLVWMMLDWSTSMNIVDSGGRGNPTRKQNIAAIAASIASASRYVGSMRMAIKAWTSMVNPWQRHSYDWETYVAGIYEAWRTGQPIDRIADLHRVTSSGTPDAWVMAHTIDAIAAEAQPGETPVILMLSDGEGYLDNDVMIERIAAARRRGIRIVSVAISGDVREDVQQRVYGHGNYITWQGDMARTAVPLARLIGRLVAE